VSVKAFIVTLVIGVLAGWAPRAGGEEPVRLHGVSLTLEEVARDGTFEISATDRFRKVDARSVLRLHFEVPLAPEELEVSPRWRGLLAMLDEIETLSSGYAELGARAEELLQATEVDSQFVKDVDAFNRNVQNLLFQATNPKFGLLTPTELTSVAAEYKTMPYVGLAHVVDETRQSLYQEAQAFAADLDQYRMIVRAYLLPGNGGRQAIHVESYDELPIGNFSRPDPTGLLPTPAEADRIASDLKAADEVVGAIREIKDNSKSLQEIMIKILREITEKVDELATSMETALESASSSTGEAFSEAFITKVEAVPTAGGEAARLAAMLREFRGEWEQLVALHERLKSVRSEVEELRQGHVTPDLIKRAIDDVTTAAREGTALFQAMSDLPDRLSRTVSLAATVGGAAAEAALSEELGAMSNAIRETIESARAALANELPATAQLIDDLGRYLSGGTLLAEGNSEIGSGGVPVIPRPLSDLPDAEVDLSTSNAVLGDRIMITADVRKTAELDTNEILPPRVTYLVETTQAGWHRRYAVNVVFVQSIASSNNKFAPNTTVSLELHHYNRQSPNGFLNKLDPSVGLHSALLHQDPDETVEIGIGVNAAILDGLVQVGYGENLSVSKHRDYWFIGFGLITALNRMKDAGDLFTR
jgi:hypothetical protein